MKKGVALILTFVLLPFAPYVLATADNSTENYGTGLVWDMSEISKDSYLELPPTEEALPSSVDLTDSFPTPGNQGSQNSCVAWAVSYALMSHHEQVKRDWGLDTDEHLFSPSYLYNLINNGKDKGSNISQAMNKLKKRGVCTLASFPYNPLDYTTQPTAEQDAEAVNYRIRDYYAVEGVDSIKRCLASGDGVILGLNIFPDFRTLSPSNPIYDNAEGTESGAHAVCLIGYDDEKSAFKFINSWGTSWGLGGYGWISYDLIENYEVNDYSDTGFVMVPRGADELFEGYFDYVITTDKKAEICGYFGQETHIKIPDTLGGYPVAGIGDKVFKDGYTLKSIIIPEHITYIGNNAFASHIKIICAENSCAHKYAVQNNINFEIVDFDARMIIPDNISDDIFVGYIELTHTSDGLCKLNAYYAPVTFGIEPLFFLAVYKNGAIEKIFRGENGEEIKNLEEEDLKDCKIFIWTKNMQPCIEAISGDITAAPKVY